MQINLPENHPSEALSPNDASLLCFFKFAHSSPPSSHSPAPCHPLTHPLSTDDRTQPAVGWRMTNNTASSREETPARTPFSLTTAPHPPGAKLLWEKWFLVLPARERGCGGWYHRYDFTWKLSIFQTLPYMVMFTRLVHFARAPRESGRAFPATRDPTNPLAKSKSKTIACCAESFQPRLSLARSRGRETSPGALTGSGKSR